MCMLQIIQKQKVAYGVQALKAYNVLIQFLEQISCLLNQPLDFYWEVKTQSWHV